MINIYCVELTYEQRPVADALRDGRSDKFLDYSGRDKTAKSWTKFDDVPIELKLSTVRFII